MTALPVRVTGLPILSAALIERGPFDPAGMDYRAAKECWREYRIAGGMKAAAEYTASGEQNAKLALSGLATRSLTLAPQGASGTVNVCALAGVCTSVCVPMTAGRGRFRSVLAGRIMRTRFLADNPQAAVTLIAQELSVAVRRYGSILARLNVASDIEWERIAPALFDVPGVRYYDYTKLNPLKRLGVVGNYRLTYSVSEAAHSDRVAAEYMRQGGTAAVVFDVRKGEPLPATWCGFPVVDGDVSDDRTADPAGVVVGLRAKGAAVGNLRVAGFVRSPFATP